ncbi:hypothetical protein, unlikely [Trypanosoma brucei gambiense DAL972]|uniref:Uncharacterized protein n=1 Tax=Trypanosoma brucei gambiense (strain MHOM/CI/86/DAL972) TaxID=679716 RepID=C9ZN20_TRYB9|nr:hypothetical protein, unlikely [Trypanosoma brucei gambiense DAL972]CBH10674.1 hypothetical protein, unlikely [Trypanosoma brucei gambiense DAL972]|eukprot:XP_011772962.1 hypothetical protein, unlikely [Trypanosoma brucei gambiense DAL972]
MIKHLRHQRQLQRPSNARSTKCVQQSDLTELMQRKGECKIGKKAQHCKKWVLLILPKTVTTPLPRKRCVEKAVENAANRWLPFRMQLARFLCKLFNQRGLS